MNTLLVTISILLIIFGIMIGVQPSNAVSLGGVTLYPNFWIGVITGLIGCMTLILGFSYGTPSHFSPKKMTEEPIEILKVRLAKGEISKEEYEELRKHLEA